MSQHPISPMDPRMDPMLGKLENVTKRLGLPEKRFQQVLTEAGEKAAADSPDRKAKEKKLMEVSRQLEAVLVKQMFKSMRATLDDENQLIHGGQSEKIFREMLDQKYAESASKRSGFGLAKQIFDQLKDHI